MQKILPIFAFGFLLGAFSILNMSSVQGQDQSKTLEEKLDELYTFKENMEVHKRENLKLKEALVKHFKIQFQFADFMDAKDHSAQGKIEDKASVYDNIDVSIKAIFEPAQEKRFPGEKIKRGKIKRLSQRKLNLLLPYGNNGVHYHYLIEFFQNGKLIAVKNPVLYLKLANGRKNLYVHPREKAKYVVVPWKKTERFTSGGPHHHVKNTSERGVEGVIQFKGEHSSIRLDTQKPTTQSANIEIKIGILHPVISDLEY